MSAIAIIGAGPRGISVLERIAAYFSTHSLKNSLDIHIIDPTEIGAGAIWRTDQSRTLCMNTLANAVTLFTEPGSTVTAPVVPGPTMYEWIVALRSKPDLSPRVATEYAQELAATRPESNPSRALYGEYLKWVYEETKKNLPAGITVVEHHAKAVSIKKTSTDTDIITLDNGESIEANATILATGWVVPEGEKLPEYPGLLWVRPDNPIDQNYTAIPDKENILVRGLGMGFFDIMALLTIDRGGVFEEKEDNPKRLRYIPSGREPHIFVTSHRGYPFLPKSEYEALPPASPLSRMYATFDKEGATNEDVREAVLRDAHEAYYRTYLKTHIGADPSILSRIDATPLEDLPALTGFNHSIFTLPEGLDIVALSQWIAQRIDEDLKEAELGTLSALKAGLWAISAARKPHSVAGFRVKEIAKVGQMVGSGPPAFRSRQLLALIEAGLVHFIGANTEITVDEQGYHAHYNGESIDSTTLVDAWMYSPDAEHEKDPLNLSLVQDSRARRFVRDGQPTASYEVDPLSRKLINVDGTEDPRVHLIGIPTHAQMPDTTISPMPGTDPLMLQETDKAAISAIHTALKH